MNRPGADEPMAMLMARRQAALDEPPYRPWWVHRLCGRIVAPEISRERGALRRLTERLGDELTRDGRAKRVAISGRAAGIPRPDVLDRSMRASARDLAEFGPMYERPAILHRLAARRDCRGL